MDLKQIVQQLELTPITRPLVEEGDRQLRLESLTYGTSETSGNLRFEGMFVDPQDAVAAPVYHYLLIPDESQQKSFGARFTELKRFIVCFGVDFNDLLKLDTSDKDEQAAAQHLFAGKLGWVFIKHEPGTVEYPEPKARIARFQVTTEEEVGTVGKTEF